MLLGRQTQLRSSPGKRNNYPLLLELSQVLLALSVASVALCKNKNKREES